jgi:hypothetical protein
VVIDEPMRRREARRAESAAMDQRTATGRETVASFAARWPAGYPRPRASTNLHNAERVKPFALAHERRRMDSIGVEEARAWAVQEDVPFVVELRDGGPGVMVRR